MVISEKPNAARRATKDQGPPLILVTNDDGIDARGIQALEKAILAAELGEVWVVAPDRDNSAVSHALTLLNPLRAHEESPRHIAVQGTPTDCVYLAAVELLPRWPTLIVSGVNAGANLSLDVHYSGTVSAAIEGTILGIPSIAVSLIHPRRGDFDLAARFAAALAKKVLLRGGLPPGLTLNVNVPDGQPSRYQMTILGRRPYAHSVHQRKDPRGRTYYWIGGDPTEGEDLAGTDSTAVREGIISVTPLLVDMTDERFRDAGKEGLVLDGFEVVGSVDPPQNFRERGD
ncbi:MAG: 5'/3'-nucleotidase SurE [Myxococcota bacterium]